MSDTQRDQETAKATPDLTRPKTYLSDERGSLTIFALFAFILLLMMAGMAVDLAHHEHARVKTQNALDTAVLAAASNTQKHDKAEVIKSYLAASGIDPDKVQVQGSSVSGESVAWAVSQADTSTIFMNLMGIDALQSNMTSRAMERVSSTEISLVLDFTSSMKGARIAALRTAVDDFVNVVYGVDCSTGTCIYPDEIPDITINVVPYGGSVNPGAYMAEKLGLQRWHGYSDCGILPAGASATTQLPYGATQQLPHFYLWWKQNLATDQEFGWCPQESTNRILYAANDPQEIKNYIAGLNLNDGTGTAIGMQWGMALLDPTSRDEINDLIGQNIVTGNTSGTFPQDDDSHILKVVLLMTDGGITHQMQPYDFEFTDLYSDDDEGGLIEPAETTEARDETLARYGDLDEDGNPRDISEIELTETNDNLKAGRNTYYSSRSDEIANLTSLCNLARAPKVADGQPRVTVFSLRFLETAQWTEDYMKPCATDPDSQYYDVTDVSALSGAFSDIARHINNLKLSLTN